MRVDRVGKKKRAEEEMWERGSFGGTPPPQRGSWLLAPTV